MMDYKLIDDYLCPDCNHSIACHRESKKMGYKHCNCEVYQNTGRYELPHHHGYYDCECDLSKSQVRFLCLLRRIQSLEAQIAEMKEKNPCEALKNPKTIHPCEMRSITTDMI